MNIKWSKVNFIAAIVGARVSMGLFSNITSPTLPTLAQNCNVSIATVSWIFTVRSVASFIGAAGVHSGRFRYIFRKFPQRTIFWSKKAFKIINPTLILSLSLGFAAICLSCIPLGRFSCWFHYYKLIIFENLFGSPISGYYAYWFWYQESPRESLQPDCNPLYWAFGELISQEHSCKHMDRFLCIRLSLVWSI